MGDIFMKILNMSITAGWLILAVLCIRLIFRKMPKWVSCLLWGVVAVRLVCPFSVESQFSVLSSTEPVKSSAIVEGEVRNYIPSIESRLIIVENSINPALTETFAYDEAQSAAPLQVVTYVAGIVWGCGMILLLMCALGSMVKLRRLVREAVCVRDNIYICDAIRSPFILGIIRPRVYLPSALHEKEMHYIIAHESAHLKRKDHWWKPLGYILLCVYWFNPLCWVAYFMLCRDIELACDEKVIKDMGFHEKKEYSKVLLSCTRQRSLVMVCPLAFGEVGIKERVKLVLSYKKPARWMIIAAAIMCVIMVLCFLTDPVEESHQLAETRAGVEAFVQEADAGVVMQEAFVQEIDAEAVMQKAGVEAVMREADAEAVMREAGEKAVTPEAIISAGGKMGGNETLEATSTAEHSIQDIVLYEQPETDKVCIKVQPSMIRGQAFYYYIPTGVDQEWLAGRMDALRLEGEPLDRRWEGHKEAGWQIVYHGLEIRGFEGGYLYYTYEDEEKGLMECFVEAPKIYDYIQIMLMEKIGYQNYDVSDIKDIVSAKLDVSLASGTETSLTASESSFEPSSGFSFESSSGFLSESSFESVSEGAMRLPQSGEVREVYSQTITDAETLEKFEEWFRNAEYILPGTDCGNRYACLELTLAGGDVMKLSMAVDRCPNFCLSGVSYDYGSAAGLDGGDFYQCFHEIPWNH